MIGHAPWNGCNLADFVMPFFLFIVGMAIALALKVLSAFLPIYKNINSGSSSYSLVLIVQKIPEKLVAIRKVILRALKLLFWGLLLQGYFSFFLLSFILAFQFAKIKERCILLISNIAYKIQAKCQQASVSANFCYCNNVLARMNLQILYPLKWPCLEFGHSFRTKDQ